MQYQQGNLNAEFVDDKNQYLQQPGAYGQPVQGVPVVGQPVQPGYQQYPYSQPYQQQPNNMYAQPYSQYPQNIQQPYPNPGYQQQVYIVPNVVMVAQPINPLVAKDLALRQYSRYFYGCNCCFGVLAFIFMIVRCVAAFNQGGGEVAAGVLYIISDFFFIVGVICGIYSISRYVERLLLYYQILIAFALVFEIIGSIILFASYGGSESEDDNNNDYGYSEDEKKSRKNVSIVFFIIALIILIICYGWFIRYARQIRFLMIDLIQSRKALANQQQVPIQSQGLLIGGN